MPQNHRVVPSFLSLFSDGTPEGFIIIITDCFIFYGTPPGFSECSRDNV
jgi:hypothetical protein